MRIILSLAAAAFLSACGMGGGGVEASAVYGACVNGLDPAACATVKALRYCEYVGGQGGGYDGYAGLMAERACVRYVQATGEAPK